MSYDIGSVTSKTLDPENVGGSRWNFLAMCSKTTIVRVYLHSNVYDRLGKAGA